ASGRLILHRDYRDYRFLFMFCRVHRYSLHEPAQARRQRSLSPGCSGGTLSTSGAPIPSSYTLVLCGYDSPDRARETIGSSGCEARGEPAYRVLLGAVGRSVVTPRRPPPAAFLSRRDRRGGYSLLRQYWPNRRLNCPLSRPSTSPSPSKSKYHR